MALPVKPISIPRVSGIDARVFTEQYRNKKPVIFSDIISDWTPIEKWTPEYLEDALQHNYEDKLRVFASKDNKHFINHPDITDVLTMGSAEFMDHVFSGNNRDAGDDITRYYLRTMSMPIALLRDIDTPEQMDSLLSVIFEDPVVVNDDLIAQKTMTFTCGDSKTLKDNLDSDDCLHKDLNMNKIVVTKESKSLAWEEFLSPLSHEEDDAAHGKGHDMKANVLQKDVSSSTTSDSICRHQDGNSRIFNADTMQLWIGTRGNVTPLHYDRNHGLLAQIVGRKELVLFSHEDTSFMYPYPSHSDRTHTSQVNLRRMGDVDYAKRFPKWEESQPYTCILQPGDLLYTPPFWWHDVTSLNDCVSVTLPWDIDGYKEFPPSMLR